MSNRTSDTTMRPEIQLLILTALLQFKHFYADFVLQTYMQTVKKGVWLNPIGISHSLEHGICTLIVLLLFSLFVPVGALLMLTLTTIEVIIHYIIDFSKVKYGCKDNTKPIFWTQFGLDQLAHQFTYLAIIWYIVL
jgi:hypothetical protein